MEGEARGKQEKKEWEERMEGRRKGGMRKKWKKKACVERKGKRRRKDLRKHTWRRQRDSNKDRMGGRKKWTKKQ